MSKEVPNDISRWGMNLADVVLAEGYKLGERLTPEQLRHLFIKAGFPVEGMDIPRSNVELFPEKRKRQSNRQ